MSGRRTAEALFEFVYILKTVNSQRVMAVSQSVVIKILK